MEILLYLLKANIVFMLLFATYLLVLRGETYFHANRAWLLGSVAVAFGLPFLQWNTPLAVALGQVLPAVGVGDLPASTDTHTTWIDLLLIGYAAGVCVHLMRFAMDLRSAWAAAARSTSDEGYSFLGRVVVPDILTGPDRDAMIAHEWAHVRQWHSVDVLVWRIVQAFNWFNPVWIMAFRELRALHEFAADAAASPQHAAYDQLLVAQALGVPTHSLTNNFRSSNLKQRLIMMHRTPSSFVARAKYLLALPVLFVSVAFAAPLPSTPAFPVRSVPQEVIAKAEQMPEFPGGSEAMMKFMMENVKYPEAARTEGKEGKVFVGFVVDAEGSITKVVTKRAVYPALDAEAERVVKAMPKWKPGMNAGKPVAVEMVLPIVFKLEADK